MIDASLPPALLAALAARGFSALTPVQEAVLRPDAAGRDLLVSARTGSGKTVAFGLALAPELMGGEGGGLPPAGAPLALVVAPTRELALQVARELGWLYAEAGGRVVSCVGGMDPGRERRALAGGAHLVVGTPGRLRDHLERGALDLSSLRAAVLDEADEMLDMGFRDELEAILESAPADRRTLLFSATLPPSIGALARRYQRDALRLVADDAGRGGGDIAYQAVLVSPADVERAAVNLLRFHEAETAILFCATRDGVRRLHASLTERGFGAVALSGEHSQSERNAALQALRDGRARVCVATDVAARGIDLPSVGLVIHAELPRDAETLLHRSGRTGRAGRSGTAVLVVPYPARRRVQAMLRAARVEAELVAVPGPDEVRARDRERLLAALAAPVEAEEEDAALGRELLERLGAEAVAAALVRSRRAALPAPEELGEAAPAPQHRAGFDDAVWFRASVGRRHRADPRWLLRLLCRRGHVARGEVGAIRVGAGETRFQVARAAAGRFAAAAGAAGPDDVLIEPVEGGPAQHPARRPARAPYQPRGR